MSQQLCGCDAQTNQFPSQNRGPAICLTDEALSDLRQRQIQGINGVSTSEYIMNKRDVFAHGDAASALDNGTKAIQKNDSYARYLAKLKGGGVLRAENPVGGAAVASYGGKVRRFGLFKYCAC